MATRIAIVLLALAAVFGVYWLVLPLVRDAMLPTAGASPGLLWVIAPGIALRFGACTVLSALTLPLLLRPLGRVWRAQDQANGPPKPLVPISRTALLIRGGILFVIYGFSGAFYFTAHGEIRETTVAFHSPLGIRESTYDELRSLHRYPPAGGQPERYGMELADGSWGYFDASSESLDEHDVSAIAAYVSERAGRPWTPAAR